VLIIQHSQRMRRITLSPVTSLAVQYLYTFSQKGTIFDKEMKIEGALWFSLKPFLQHFTL
jgi:hypothetical protein